uniref:Uncharacterized protein n=1 Tax=Syphacia muris TaxID=451379 RepID=A0A0N5AN29_9BILA
MRVVGRWAKLRQSNGDVCAKKEIRHCNRRRNKCSSESVHRKILNYCSTDSDPTADYVFVTIIAITAFR